MMTNTKSLSETIKIREKNITALADYFEENERNGLEEWYWHPWLNFLFHEIILGKESKIH